MVVDPVIPHERDHRGQGDVWPLPKSSPSLHTPGHEHLTPRLRERLRAQMREGRLLESLSHLYACFAMRR